MDFAIECSRVKWDVNVESGNEFSHWPHKYLRASDVRLIRIENEKWFARRLGRRHLFMRKTSELSEEMVIIWRDYSLSTANSRIFEWKRWKLVQRFPYWLRFYQVIEACSFLAVLLNMMNKIFYWKLFIFLAKVLSNSFLIAARKGPAAI